VVVSAILGKGLFTFTIVSSWEITGRGFVVTIVVDAIAIALYLLGF